MARLTPSAPWQAAAAPPGNRVAAASAARSAAACARCRATTAVPTRTPSTATVSTTTIIRAASTVAAPASSQAGFDRRDRGRGDDQPRQQRGAAADSGNHISAVAADLEGGVGRCHRARHGPGRGVIAARCQPRRLPCRVDAPNLRRDRRDAADTRDEDRDQCGDRECCLDGAEAGIVGYTLVFRARLMMLVSAPTIESPVTTL